MANQVLRLWEGVLESLSHIASNNHSTQRHSMDTLALLLLELSSMPDQPKATVKRLVQDVKLPYKLGLFGNSKLLPDPYAAGPLLPAAFAQAVSHMLKAVLGGKGGQAPLVSIMMQQSTDTQLFECLHQLTNAAADQLEQVNGLEPEHGLSAAAAAAANDISSPFVPIGRNDVLQLTACRLLGIQEALQPHLYDYGTSWRDKLAASAAASMRLETSAMSHISTFLQHYTTSTPPPNAVLDLTAGAASSTVRLFQCVATLSKLGGAAAQEVMTPEQLRAMGPHFLAWSHVHLVLVTYARSLHQHSRLPTAGTCAGGSSSSTTAGSSAAHAVRL